MSDAAPVSTFSLHIDHADGAAMVRCHGRLVAGVCDFLYVEVSKLLPDTRRIVLDLTDLSHMDSMGIGTVVRLWVSARSAGSEVQLINLGKQIRELLGATNLLSVFTVIGEGGIRIP